jgi:hypothetical protein
MTDKQYVKQTAGTRILQNSAGGVICLCADAYLSSIPWASVILWCIGASCFVTVGYMAAVLNMAEKFSNKK